MLFTAIVSYHIKCFNLLYLFIDHSENDFLFSVGGTILSHGYGSMYPYTAPQTHPAMQPQHPAAALAAISATTGIPTSASAAAAAAAAGAISRHPALGRNCYAKGL